MFRNANYNFLGTRKISFSVVGIFVAIVVISLFARGLNQGIDFSGGRNYIVKFEKPVSTAQTRYVSPPTTRSITRKAIPKKKSPVYSSKPSSPSSAKA